MKPIIDKISLSYNLLECYLSLLQIKTIENVVKGLISLEVQSLEKLSIFFLSNFHKIFLLSKWILKNEIIIQYPNVEHEKFTISIRVSFDQHII
jgi:hypothetical protein